MKLALCQLSVSENKKSNLTRARDMLHRAADQGADMAILPEMFSIAYVADLFMDAAEPCPEGESAQMLSETAKETKMFIIGGSVPELEEGKLFNTSMSFDASGAFMGKYQKAHLFDVDIPKKNYRFIESDTIAPGNRYPLLLPSAPIKTGVAICFDIRFPEWARLIMQGGADMMALPAAFSNATGPRHWELLLRARALDNQFFVAAVSPAHSKSAHGHSILASPDGAVVHDCGTEECLAVVEVDFSILEELRASIAVKQNRRMDLYELKQLKS